MIDSSSPACKLVSMFSAHSEDKTVPHELQFITYPDDKQQLGSMVHDYRDFDLGVYADSFTHAEACELNAMAEAFAGHYAELLGVTASHWSHSLPEHHLHLAHVRAPCCRPRPLSCLVG